VVFHIPPSYKRFNSTPVLLLHYFKRILRYKKKALIYLMTDDEMKDFMKNQLERQNEWRQLYIKQKKQKVKDTNILTKEARRISMKKYRESLV
jgi:hypothetical protein